MTTLPISETLLVTLQHVAAHPGIRLKALAEAMGVGMAAASARLSVLSGRGLVSSRVGRGQSTATKAGVALLAAAERKEVTVTPAGPQPKERPSAAARRYLGRHAAGWSLQRIADHYGVTKQAVHAVVTRWSGELVRLEVAAELRNARR